MNSLLPSHKSFTAKGAKDAKGAKETTVSALRDLGDLCAFALTPARPIQPALYRGNPT
jgi:hypothetical protein